MGEGSPGVQWMLATPIPCDATSVSPRVSLTRNDTLGTGTLLLGRLTCIKSVQKLLLFLQIISLRTYRVGIFVRLP